VTPPFAPEDSFASGPTKFASVLRRRPRHRACWAAEKQSSGRARVRSEDAGRVLGRRWLTLKLGPEHCDNRLSYSNIGDRKADV